MDDQRIDREGGSGVNDEDTIFYWTEWREFDDAGQLYVKVSGFDRDGSHWTGYAEIGKHHPDYKLWCWIFRNGRRYGKLIEKAALSAIREDFNARQNGWIAHWRRLLTRSFSRK
jgi:hypothetical protein